MIAIERNLVTPRWQRVALPIVSLVMASIIAGIVLAVSGHDPLGTYRQIYAASFTADGALTATFIYATPLLFTGLAVASPSGCASGTSAARAALHGRRRRVRRGPPVGGWPLPLLIVAMIARRARWPASCGR